MAIRPGQRAAAIQCRLTHIPALQTEKKKFVFGKKTKKLLQIKLVFWIELGLLCPKVFCFFFSKKKALLPCLVYRWDIGEELVRNFPVYIQEDFDRRQDFDMLLGMDWIAKHHLWLSYSTDSLYIDSGEKKPPEWKPAPKLPGE